MKGNIADEMVKDIVCGMVKPKSQMRFTSDFLGKIYYFDTEKDKVGINGYGVIGKRIADAILLQDDMELVGVTARTPDYRLFSANKKGIKVFGVDPEACNRLMNSGVKCNGDFNHFIKRVDVVIDATPAGIGKENKVKYDTAKVKSIFQGGEEHEL